MNGLNIQNLIQNLCIWYILKINMIVLEKYLKILHIVQVLFLKLLLEQNVRQEHMLK